jgi:hypothetical protein
MTAPKPDFNSSTQLIPRSIFTFWDSDTLPPLVKGAIRLMRQQNVGWSVNVLSTKNLKEYGLGHVLKLCGAQGLTQAHLADLIRLETLSRFGGVWLDASIITTKPLEAAWIDVSRADMHGFVTPWSSLRFPKEDFEGFAVAVRRDCPLMRAWAAEFRCALGAPLTVVAARPELITLTPASFRGLTGLLYAWGLQATARGFHLTSCPSRRPSPCRTSQ